MVALAGMQWNEAGLSVKFVWANALTLMALNWGESRVDYLQHGSTCMCYFWIRVWNVSQNSERLPRSLWMEACILMWNKIGIQNGFCRQQLLKAWGDWQLEFRRGLCKWPYFQLRQRPLRVQYQHKICLAVVPLNEENRKRRVTLKAMPILTWSVLAGDFKLGDSLACSYSLSLPVG